MQRDTSLQDFTDQLTEQDLKDLQDIFSTTDALSVHQGFFQQGSNEAQTIDVTTQTEADREKELTELKNTSQLNLTLIKRELLNAQHKGVIDDKEKEVEQALEVSTSLEDILKMIAQIIDVLLSMQKETVEETTNFWNKYEQASAAWKVTFLISIWVRKDKNQPIYFDEQLLTVVQKQKLDDVKNAIARYLTLEKPEKTLLELHPTIIEYIASFLEEAIKDTPSVATLYTWASKTVTPIQSYFRVTGSAEERKIPEDDYNQYCRISASMYHAIDFTKGQETKQTTQELLQSLYQELEKLNSNGVISDARMRKLGEAIQGLQPREISPAMTLHQRLEGGGGYERLRQLDPRRAILLQTYLTTDKSALDAGKEVGLNSRSRSTELLHSAMELAFFTLPENERAEYDNNPAKALQTRSRQQTQTKRNRLKEAHSNRPKNQDTGKIEYSATHKENIAAANQRRGKAYREGTYTGKPIGRPRKNATPTA